MRGAVLLALVAACAASPGEPIGQTVSAIVDGSPASAYPEAVLVTNVLPICSGVLLAPRVVLSAGHCRSEKHTYTVTAPQAGGQVATASRDWTTFDGEAANSSDTLLIFLDEPIQIPSYPVIPAAEVSAGTTVVDVGRTLNGMITDGVWVSGPVTIEGPGTPLGFPYNYEAQPDISQDGDSGGPIEVPGMNPHQVVGIVDTDTVEQNISEATPIDLFARLDVVREEILAQVATEADGGGASDGGDAAGAREASTADAGRVKKEAGGEEKRDAGVAPTDAGGAPPAAGGSCAVVGARGGEGAGLLVWGVVVGFRRRTRRIHPFRRGSIRSSGTRQTR